MANTTRGIYYPSEYASVADVPEDMKKMAKSIVSILEEQDCKILDLEKNTTTQEEKIQNNIVEIVELQQENTDLKNLLPTVSGEGENVTLDNTGEARFKKLVVGGNSWQETSVESKNKLDLSKPFLVGKVYSSNGTESDEPRANIYSLKLKEGKTYFIYIAEGGSYFTKWKNNVFVSREVKSKSIVEITKDETFDEVRYSLFTDVEDFSNSYINEGENTGYEPFVPQMPSPEFKSDIRNVGDNVNLIEGELSNGYWIPESKSLTDISNLIFKSFKVSVKAGTYVLSCNNNINVVRAFTDYDSSAVVIFSEVVSVNIKTYVMILTEDTTLYISVRRNDNTNWLDTDLLKLEKGTIETTYSKPKCGNANITVCNENIFDSENWYETLQAINSESMTKEVVDGIEYYKFRPVGIYAYKYMRGYFKENTQYIITAKARQYNNDTQTSTGFKIYYTDGTNTTAYINQTVQEYDYKAPSIAGKTIDYISLGYAYGNYALMRDIQIIEGTEQKDYIEHQSQSFTFPLSEGQRLYKDSDLLDDGVHYKRKQRVFDGTENWLDKNYDTYGFFNVEISDKAYGKTNLMCSHFKVSTDEIKYGNLVNGRNNNTMICFYPSEDVATTLDEWKTYLTEQFADGTPVTVEYELENEVVEAYTEEQQIVYNQIKKAKSYLGQTNVYSTDEISPIFNAEAFVDLKTLLTTSTSEVGTDG